MVDCGWGRLLFGHTFDSNESVAQTLLEEGPGKRDLAFYLSDPHVVLSYARQDLFLDPSHTFRLYLEKYRQKPAQRPFVVRKLQTRADATAINEIYLRRHMVAADPDFVWRSRRSKVLTYVVAEDEITSEIIGVVLGIDHVEAFNDPEKGCSLWALAVDPRTCHPGVGHTLVTHVLEHFIARGRAFLDLSVMHDNSQAIRLYEKLGFVRVPIFCVKRKNSINESLFAAKPPDAQVNPYAQIIIREALRRGISVEVQDAEYGYFELSSGGRSVACRESLTELTSAVAMSRCDDKRVTRSVLTRAGLQMPDQTEAGRPEANAEFLQRYGRVVVKPARGEQGVGVAVDLRSAEELEHAVERARQVSTPVIIEQLVDGEDLRVIVINYKMVAAAVRRPPQITGTGEHTARQLIEKQSRRRSAATDGESHIPLDAETERCVNTEGFGLDEVLPHGKTVTVRKTANLHTGGTIHDVTGTVHPALAAAAERAAEALNIPVVGLDLMVPAVDGPEYHILEANERPGLANHEPQPTAERFVDLLFPQTASELA
jgi:GNAT-family acetyltransferase (TIGR03103 family)